MNKINLTPLKHELSQELSKPWRLPRNLLFAALGTFAGLAVGVLIHGLKRGLPYIAADVFIWTLATYNAAQLGSDSLRVLNHTKKSNRIKELFIVKNITLLSIAVPIDIILIVIACTILGDWSKLGESVIYAISAVIICLGLGNLVSVIWVYNPISYLKLMKDRVLIFEYIIFISIAYIAATVAILLAAIPGELLIKNINIHSLSGKIIGTIIMLAWALLLWFIFLFWADNLSRKFNKQFIGRLNGERIKIKNSKLRKILKVYDS